MRRLLDILASLRLTLAVLLGLALAAVGGTLTPFGPDEVPRYDLYYQAPWFRALLGLLVLNLAVCTWKTWQRLRGERARLVASLAATRAGNGPPGVPLAAALDGADCRARLGRLGYHVLADDDLVLGRRGRARRWAVPTLHVALVVIMLAAWAGELGFVGTLNLYAGTQTDQYFDWDSQADRPLGFAFRLDRFEPRYYPIDLRFAVLDPVSRELRAEYTSREGETVDLGGGLSVTLERFYPEEEHLVLAVRRAGVAFGQYHALSGQRNHPGNPDLGVIIRPSAFRDPVLRQLHSEVSILEDGQVVRQAVIEVNRPLTHRGVAIYQTAYQRTSEGVWAGGFQVSRDPGEGLVWVGCVLFSLALLAVFYVRYQAVGVVYRDGAWQLVGLAGFRGDDGRERLARLAEALAAPE